MFGTFYRSFYLIFIGLFTMLFLSAGGVTLNAALLGNPSSTIVGAGMAALCWGLIVRALDYLRE